MVVCGLYNPGILNLQIRQNDRLAVSKLVTSLTRGTVRSPLAQCLLIRYTSQVYICSLMFFNVWISSSCFFPPIFIKYSMCRLSVSQAAHKQGTVLFMIFLRVACATRLKWWFLRLPEQSQSSMVSQVENWLQQLLFFNSF